MLADHFHHCTADPQALKDVGRAVVSGG
jgi:hypothetical protein